MKCLSLWQPWASLMAYGAKGIETRSWDTAYRGPLLIHAAKKWDRELSDTLCSEPINGALITRGWQPAGSRAFGLPLGAIIAAVDLRYCRRVLEQNRFSALLTDGILVGPYECQFGDYYPGRYGWGVDKVLRFQTPIPFVGHQGLFNVPDELVADAIAHAIPVTPSPCHPVTSSPCHPSTIHRPLTTDH